MKNVNKDDTKFGDTYNSELNIWTKVAKSSNLG